MSVPQECWRQSRDDEDDEDSRRARLCAGHLFAPSPCTVYIRWLCARRATSSLTVNFEQIHCCALSRRTASTLTHPSAPSEKNVHSCCKIILQFITFQNIAPTHSSPVSSVLFRPQCTRAGNSGAACARTWMIRARRHRRSGTSCNQRC